MDALLTEVFLMRSKGSRLVALVLLLVLLSGCQGGLFEEASVKASLSERESMEASLSLLVAQDTGGLRGYRKGFLYIEPDLICYEGQLYEICYHYIRATKNMVYLGEITATVDDVPENDFENSRDLDPGTKLYRLPSNTSYIIAVPSWEKPIPGNLYQPYHNPRGLPELGLQEIPPELIPPWEVFFYSSVDTQT
jgi:hypothetical protein